MRHSLLNGNSDWGLVLTALLVVIASFGLLMEYYYRVHRPREKDKEQKRNEIYKPLVNNLNILIERVKQKEAVITPFDWKTVEDKVPAQLFERIQNLYEDKVDYYQRLSQHIKDFIRYKICFDLNSYLSGLQEEFHKLGVGKLEYELFNSIVTPIMDGEKITLRWLEENKPELYENLEKCPNHKRLKELLDSLNEENPCIMSFRKIVHDLLQSTKEIEDKMKSF